MLISFLKLIFEVYKLNLYLYLLYSDRISISGKYEEYYWNILSHYEWRCCQNAVICLSVYKIYWT